MPSEGSGDASNSAGLLRTAGAWTPAAGVGPAGVDARIWHAGDRDGLMHAEYLVLEPLDEDTPMPLWAIAGHFVAGV